MTVPPQIGTYDIVRLLGAGSFATVWLGHDPALGAHVAIKVLAENWAHDLRVRERFREEARLLWRLDDQRVVRVHAVGSLPDGRPYSVMDFADGGSLRDRLARGNLPPAEALHVLREIAAGVAVLHRHRIVHRDLTPGNVLFRSAPERVVIADLGLAKALAAASGLTARAGTPGYMAPEQDDPLATVDTSADVYGLGRLGERLGVPGAVAPVLRRATARYPRDRYPDADAFLVALDRAVRRGGALTPVGRVVGFVAAGVFLVGITSDVARPEGIRIGRDGPVSVVLPAGWEPAGSGWAGQFDVAGRPEPALVISPDPPRWLADPAVPGAFVGLSHSAAARTTAAGFVAEHPHASCAAAPVRHTRQAGIDWVVARFTCTLPPSSPSSAPPFSSPSSASPPPGASPPTSASSPASPKPVIIEAAGLDAGSGAIVYVQIAPVAGASDRDIDALLAGVVVD